MRYKYTFDIYAILLISPYIYKKTQGLENKYLSYYIEEKK